MYIAILGRQPALSVAELESIYGSQLVRWLSDQAALIDTDNFDFNRLGGSQKAGRVVLETSSSWRQVSKTITQYYAKAWQDASHKITLGISVYGLQVPAREVQRTAITLKKQLRQHNVSLRTIPNQEPALNTATSHHNKLGLSANKVELLVVQARGGRIYIAESIGAQNITALAARDQARPKTDAFVGMLPPKLARMMINMTVSQGPGRLLDPFCGTGVVLQEAALLDFTPYGSDLSEKMVDYSTHNLAWLADKCRLDRSVWRIEPGDAMKHSWQPPIDLIVAEAYLGQPFSAPPSPAKLREVRGNCNHIISEFLKNVSTQIASGTPLTLAVPAWRDTDGRFTHLPLIHELESFGYRRRELKRVEPHQLLYYRENQVVARELLLLEKI